MEEHQQSLDLNSLWKQFHQKRKEEEDGNHSILKWKESLNTNEHFLSTSYWLDKTTHYRLDPTHIQSNPTIDPWFYELEIIESHHDLQVVSTSHEKSHVASTLHERLSKYCTTSIGKCWMYTYLLYPLTTKQEIDHRREIIEYFITTQQSPPLSIPETKIAWYFEDIQPEVQVLLSKVYIQWEWFEMIGNFLNESLYFHRGVHMYKIFLNPILQIVFPIFIIVGSFFGSIWMISKTGWRQTYSFWKHAFSFLWSSTTSKSKLTMILSVCIYIFTFFYNIYQSIQEVYFLQTIYEQLYETIQPMIQLYKQTKEWFDKIPKHYIPTHLLSSLEQSIELYEKMIPTMFMEDETWNSKRNWCMKWLMYPRSEIAILFYQIYKVREQCLPMITYLGWIDAMRNIVKCYEEEKGKVCWARYREEKKPYIVSKQMFYPLLLDDKNIPNPVDICQEKGYHRIITGPNAAGKSTYLKSIGLNQHMAQTVGYVFAKEYECSIFEQFHSQLQLQDLKGAYSLFEAEMLRCQIFLEKIQNGKLSLCLFDELFSSTNVSEGFASAFAFVEYCIKREDICFVMTTHYGLLKSLEKEYKQKCKMIRFDIERDKETKKIHYPYTLKEGVSKQWIALELLSYQPRSKEWLHRAQEMIPMLQKMDKLQCKKLEKWIQKQMKKNE
jgi:energy-coupling factor transporter ATP-binding protein EcfA2